MSILTRTSDISFSRTAGGRRVLFVLALPLGEGVWGIVGCQDLHPRIWTYKNNGFVNALPQIAIEPMLFQLFAETTLGNWSTRELLETCFPMIPWDKPGNLIGRPGTLIGRPVAPSWGCPPS